MDFNRIEELLEKYWNGETTLEEEKILRTFFNGGDVPEKWKETASMFQYFEASKGRSLNDVAFDGEILKMVQPKKEGRVARMVYNSMRIAAGLAVVITATWFIHNEVKTTIPQEVADTYDDPKMAFEETKKALLMISKSFGKAEEQARKINMFNQAQEEIQGNQNID